MLKTYELYDPVVICSKGFMGKFIYIKNIISHWFNTLYFTTEHRNQCPHQSTQISHPSQNRHHIRHPFIH
jgi:hypothetical protein